MPILATRRRAGLAATGAVALLLLTACGSSSSSSSSSGAGGDDAFAAYAQCMSDNGVTLPTGGPGGAGGPGGTPPSGAPSGLPDGAPGGMPSGAPSGMPGGAGMVPDGVDASAFAAAQQACASLRPSGGPGAGAGAPAIDSGALAAYTGCLKDHDVTATTPADLRALDTSDATVAAALATCAPLRPTPVASPSASPST